MNTQYSIVALAFVALILVAGCTTTRTAQGNTDSKILPIGEMWEPDSIDPAGHDSGTLICEKALITETLVGANADFSLKPALATSWKQREPHTWEFTLRPGVVFQDGTPLTASAVKFSLDRVARVNPSVKEMMKYASSEVVNETTLRITTTEENPVLPAYLHYPAISIISPTSLDANGDLIKPIGTGPMTFRSFDEQTGTLTVEKNEQWWGGGVGLDGMVLRPITDPNTRALAIENGEVDFTVDVPYSETDMINAMDGINVEKYETPRLYKIDCNLNHTPLQDTRVRQAISSAINRDDIVTNVLYNVGKPAAGPFLPSMVWADKSLAPYPCNQTKARVLLGEAGWTDTDGDGILDKNGAPLELEMITYSERPGLPPMGEAIAAELKEAGIKVDFDVMEYGSLDDRRKAGDWDLYLAAYTIAMVPDPQYILTNWYSTDGTDNNAGYSNPAVDALIEEAGEISDLNTRYQKFSAVQDIVYDDLPIIPVAYYGVAIVKKDTVNGYVFDPTAHDYRINPNMTIEA
ncbi:MAG: peptide/nickel transport system substrate-binding protein [Methanofollis sp.]|nr:peptide/nickel transport system substrate-binding protein [Methanofollis sp.]